MPTYNLFLIKNAFFGTLRVRIHPTWKHWKLKAEILRSKEIGR